MRLFFLGLAFAAALFCNLACVFAAEKLVVTPDRESGVYKAGETVKWTVRLTSETKAAETKPAEAKIEYEVRKGGIKSGESQSIELRNGEAEISAKREDAGNLLLVVQYRAEGKKEPITAYGGAVYDPEAIKISAPAPDDFDAFWKAKIDELHAIPMNAKIEKVDIGNPKIEYFKFTLDHVKGRKVYGQIAKPAGGTNLPAMLQVQWAGVYPLSRDWITGHAENGWLAVNIMAHDLPIDEKPEFYAEKAKGELNDYPGQGNDDRETSYFLPMFLSCRRAVDFITEHGDWNKRALVVHGGSQGGYQSIVAAGLAPAVTAIAANVPAGCDHTGAQAGREPGWPNWASRTWTGRDAKKMLDTSRYFDAMNFASRVKCPALVGVAVVDTACPVEGVLATCNALQGDKKMVLMPLADHGGDHAAYYREFGPFLEKQRQREE